MLNGLLRPAGLPLFHDEKKGRKERINVKSQMARYSGIAIRYIRSILADPRTRNVFFFLLLNVSFTIVEALYGMWTNSLGLASDALHMLFDSSAIAMGLIASVIAKWPPTERFSFGFARVETMAGFVNAGGLVLASIGILWESVTRFLDPPDIITDKLLIVAVLGLLVNLGVYSVCSLDLCSLDFHSQVFAGLVLIDLQSAYLPLTTAACITATTTPLTTTLLMTTPLMTILLMTTLLMTTLLMIMTIMTIMTTPTHMPRTPTPTPITPSCTACSSTSLPIPSALLASSSHPS